MRYSSLLSSKRNTTKLVKENTKQMVDCNVQVLAPFFEMLEYSV